MVFIPANSRCIAPPRCMRQLLSRAVQYSAFVESTSCSFAVIIADETSAFLTENVPPNPQQRSRFGRGARSSASGSSPWGRGNCGSGGRPRRTAVLLLGCGAWRVPTTVHSSKGCTLPANVPSFGFGNVNLHFFQGANADPNLQDQQTGYSQTFALTSPGATIALDIPISSGLLAGDIPRYGYVAVLGISGIGMNSFSSPVTLARDNASRAT